MMVAADVAKATGCGYFPRARKALGPLWWGVAKW